MPTVIADPPPAGFEALLERRRDLGLDRWDEVWEGVLHINPPPNRAHERLSMKLAVLLDPLAEAAGLDLLGTVGVGVVDEHRTPDLALQRPSDAEPQWQDTVELAVEIRSPNDDTFKKLDFYAAHNVNELVVVDSDKRTVDWFALTDGEYRPVERSALIDLGPAGLAQAIDWPPVEP